MAFTSKYIHHIRLSEPRFEKKTCSPHFNPRLSLQNVWICSRFDSTNSFAMQISVANHAIHVAQETPRELKLLSGTVHRIECMDFGNFKSSNILTKHNLVVKHMKCNKNYLEGHSWFYSKLGAIIIFSRATGKSEKSYL